MWSDQYFPGRKGLAPCLLDSPARDQDFGKSVSATIWPRAAVAAGSFWRWDETMSPEVQPELFNSVVARANAILIARGVETCPCANATWNGCNVGTRCGVAWCNSTAAQSDASTPGGGGGQPSQARGHGVH